MTGTRADQTIVRSTNDRSIVEQTYKGDTDAFERTEPMNDGNGSQPTEDDSYGGRAND